MQKGSSSVGELERLRKTLDALLERLPPYLGTPVGPHRDGAVTRAFCTLEERIDAVQREIRHWNLRREYITQNVFSDPAWGILLELYFGWLRNRPITIKQACIASGVPQTTALRWLTNLAQQCWLQRESDPSDARRGLLTPTSTAVSAMTRYFDIVTDTMLAPGVARPLPG